MSRESAFKSTISILLIFTSTTLWWIVDLVFNHYPLTKAGIIFSLFGFLFSLLSYLSLFAIFASFIKKMHLLFGVSLMTHIPLVLLISNIVPLFFTVVVFSLMQTYVLIQLSKRVNVFTKINIRQIYSTYFKSSFLLLAVVISVCFYFFYIPRKPEKIHLPEQAAETIIEQVFSLFGKALQLPTEGDPQQSLDWVVQEGREENIGQRLPESIISVLRGKDASSETLREFLSDQQANGGPQLGITELRTQIEDELNNVLKPYLGYLPLIFATSLFLTLRFITPLVVLLAVGFLSALLWMLRKAGVLVIVEKSVQAERFRLFQ